MTWMGWDRSVAPNIVTGWDALILTAIAGVCPGDGLRNSMQQLWLGMDPCASRVLAVGGQL